MKTQKILLLALLFAAFTPLTHAAPLDLSAPIPVDEKLVQGTLPNGLSYYILPNQRPEQKVELRLVVKAGSLNEAENQLGLAHFLEHMAFNGTTHFPKQTLVDQLQRMGVQFGADLNAYTSFGETVYILPIPTHAPENLETGMQILEDWGFHMNLEPAAIDQERKIVMEEWRLRAQNPASEIGDKNIGVALNQSLFKARLPIGKMDVIQTFKPETLREFYQRWYRPDMMAVIVVGDVSADKARTLIERHFGSKTNPATRPVLPNTAVPNNEQPLVGVFAHKDLPDASVMLFQKEAASSHVDKITADYVKNMKHQLINAMMNERLAALQDDPKTPLNKAYSANGYLYGVARDKRSFYMGSGAMAGQELAALTALRTEAQRVVDHGFNQAELDRAARNLLANLESSFNNRDKVESASKAEEYIRAVVELENTPSLDWEYEAGKTFVPQITLAQLNELARTYFTPDNRIALINTNQVKPSLNKAAVLAALNQPLKTSALSAEASEQTLLKTLPSAGTITAKSYDKALDLTTLQLSNGVQVRLKKTDFSDNSVSFGAYSDGGYSLVNDDVWRKTQWAYDGVSEAGFNGYSNTALKKILSGKVVSVGTDINEDSQNVKGEFAPQDAKTAFELIYSQMTGLNHDKAAFERFVLRSKNDTANLDNDRMTAFVDHVRRKLNQNNPRFAGTYPKATAWNTMDYDAAYQVTKQRFSNANGMRFDFVGKIDEAQLTPLVEQYLASLPSDKTQTPAFKDLGYRSDKTAQTIEFKKGSENLSVVSISINGDTPYVQKDALALRLLGEILTIKLTEHLREVDGGVYSINASGEMRARPYGAYSFNIGFPCAPDKADTLIQSAQKKLARLIQNGPDELDLEKVKKSAVNALHENLKKNSFWVDSLQTTAKRGQDAQEILRQEQYISALSRADLQQTAQKYLSVRPIVAVLKPQSKR